MEFHPPLKLGHKYLNIMSLHLQDVDSNSPKKGKITNFFFFWSNNYKANKQENKLGVIWGSMYPNTQTTTQYEI